MSIKIKTWRDPYDAGFSPTKPKEIELYEGLTVLVGCNGAGKSTLLHNIKGVCREQNIPCHMFDNLSDGGDSLFGSVLNGFKDMPGDDMFLAVNMFNSSEGETIRLHVARQAQLFEEFFKTGYFKDGQHRFSSIFAKELPDVVDDNRRFLLFDATDSGVSIDAICEIKQLFKNTIDLAMVNNIDLYIIIAANEYELCRHEKCFDVNTGKYISFKDYEDYRNFILKSRERKEKRLDRQLIWKEKQKCKELKEFKKYKEKVEQQAKVLKEKLKKENREPNGIEQHGVLDVERSLKDFINGSRFLNYDLLEKEVINV